MRRAIGAAIGLATIFLHGTARAQAPEHVVAPEAAVLVAYRSGPASSGYPVEDRLRGGFRGGASWGLSRQFTLGLFYERTGAGRERIAYADTGYASDTSRSLHAVLADVRVFAANSDAARVFLELGVGFSFEAVEQSGVRLTPAPVPYRCNASSSASAVFAAGLGGEIELARGFAFVGRAFGAAHRLGDDPLSDASAQPCAPGAGSMFLLGVSAGLAYRFDLARLRLATSRGA